MELTVYEQMELEYEFSGPARLLSDEQFKAMRALDPWELAKLPSDLRIAYYCTQKWHADRNSCIYSLAEFVVDQLLDEIWMKSEGS